MFADLPPDLKEDANGLFPLDEGLMHFKLIDWLIDLNIGRLKTANVYTRLKTILTPQTRLKRNFETVILR